MLERVQCLGARAAKQDGPAENEAAVVSSGLESSDGCQRVEEDAASGIARAPRIALLGRPGIARGRLR